MPSGWSRRRWPVICPPCRHLPRLGDFNDGLLADGPAAVRACVPDEVRGLARSAPALARLCFRGRVQIMTAHRRSRRAALKDADRADGGAAVKDAQCPWRFAPQGGRESGVCARRVSFSVSLGIIVGSRPSSGIATRRRSMSGGHGLFTITTLKVHSIVEMGLAAIRIEVVAERRGGESIGQPTGRTPRVAREVFDQVRLVDKSAGGGYVAPVQSLPDVISRLLKANDARELFRTQPDASLEAPNQLPSAELNLLRHFTDGNLSRDRVDSINRLLHETIWPLRIKPGEEPLLDQADTLVWKRCFADAFLQLRDSLSANQRPQVDERAGKITNRQIEESRRAPGIETGQQDACLCRSGQPRGLQFLACDAGRRQQCSCPLHLLDEGIAIMNDKIDHCGWQHRRRPAIPTHCKLPVFLNPYAFNERPERLDGLETMVGHG